MYDERRRFLALVLFCVRDNPTAVATAKSEAMLEFQICSFDRSGPTTSETWKARSIGVKGSMSSTGTTAREKPTGWKPFICWRMQSHSELGIFTKQSRLAKRPLQCRDRSARA